MRAKTLQRIVSLLLCAVLCAVIALPLTGAASAADMETAGVEIEIGLPSDWAVQRAAARICVADHTGCGIAAVEAKTDQNGVWQDITGSMAWRDGIYYGELGITGNCTVYIRVTGGDGQIYEDARYIECFDRTPPVLSVKISGDRLLVEATDDLSGVTEITVDGKRYTGLSNGTLDYPLSKVSASTQQIVVKAVDYAGNQQSTQIKSPNYQEKAAPAVTETPTTPPVTSEPPAATTPPVTTTPPTTTTPPATNVPPAVTTPSAGSEPDTDSDTDTPSADGDGSQSPNGGQTSAPLTPDGQGEVVDNSGGETGKQFYTIYTPDENVFYLIIDNDRDGDNVYFLSAVTESDLAALAQKDDDTSETPPTESAVPEPPACVCRERCEAGEVNTKCPVCVLSWQDCEGVEASGGDPAEPQQPAKNSSGTMVVILLAVAAVGGAGYYLKIYKPKHDLDDAEDFDELTEAEETVNEDDVPDQERIPYDEPPYPGDYGYGDPEDDR